MKIVVGLILGLAIGAACRWFDIPSPSPPKLMGALLVVAMTLGYIAADVLIAKRFAHRGEATNAQLCGGPTGLPHSQSNLKLARSQPPESARDR